MNWLRRLGLPPRPVRIGAVSFRECGRLAEIHAGAFARPWSAEDFDRFMTDASVRIDGLFVGRDTEPSGFVVSRRALDEAEILSVAIARPARGRGASHRLLDIHVQALAYAGVRRIHLEVEEGNLPALALYRRAGFVPSGRRPDYYARPDGTRASAISMTLRLGEADVAAAG